MAAQRRTRTNWAGNVAVPSKALQAPTSLGELQDAVAGAKTVRVIGSGHSFVPCMVTDGDGVTVDMRAMPKTFELDAERGTCTVDGGMTYTELAARLCGTGFTLANTQSLPHTTVAGTVATGTHGSSGVDPATGRAKLGSQSAQVAALEFLDPSGDTHWLRRGDPDFDGAVISFGCLGPITKVALDVVPDYDVLQAIYGTMGADTHHPVEVLLEGYTDLLRAHDSVSVMVDWPRADAGMIVARTFGPPSVPIEPAPEWRGMPLVTDPLPPLLGTDRVFHSTAQGTALNTLFWFLDTDTGEVFGPQPPEHQLEYFVPLSDAGAALSAVRRVAERWGEPVASDPTGAPLLLYCELRVVRGDGLWLAPYATADGGDTLALAFGINRAAGKRVLEAASDMERAIAPFVPRPHWAKLHSMRPREVTALYGDRWDAFCDLCERRDPGRKFVNRWAATYLDSGR